jgi:hypothetical protein
MASSSCVSHCPRHLHPTQSRNTAIWRQTTLISMSTCVGVLLSLAIPGYLHFRGITNADILNNFTVSDNLMNFTRVAYTVTMMLTYPIEFVVARHSVLALANITQRLSTARHVAVSLVVFSASLACALATDDVGFVVELTGGCCASTLGFLLPAALYIRIKKVPLVFWRDARPLSEVLPVVCVLAFGATAFIATTWQALGKSEED